MMAIGQALRRMRLLEGMKQEHLAALMGVAQTTVSRWERGALALGPEQWRQAQRLLAASPDPSRDAALKRLVDHSSLKVHLICDRTHRLLAASPARWADWRVGLEDLLGRTLLVYASPEILAAEARLDALGWHEGRSASSPSRPGRTMIRWCRSSRAG